MYNSYIMKRTQIYLEEEQDAALARRASSTGVTKSTLIRQAIDSFLDGPTDNAARLARFRSALADLGDAPLHLPDGKSYVEKLRALDQRRQEDLEKRRA